MTEEGQITTNGSRYKPYHRQTTGERHRIAVPATAGADVVHRVGFELIVQAFNEVCKRGVQLYRMTAHDGKNPLLSLCGCTVGSLPNRVRSVITPR